MSWETGWNCWAGGMETYRPGPEHRCYLSAAHPIFAAVAEAVIVLNKTVMRQEAAPGPRAGVFSELGVLEGCGCG